MNKTLHGKAHDKTSGGFSGHSWRLGLKQRRGGGKGAANAFSPSPLLCSSWSLLQATSSPPRSKGSKQPLAAATPTFQTTPRWRDLEQRIGGWRMGQAPSSPSSPLLSILNYNYTTSSLKRGKKTKAVGFVLSNHMHHSARSRVPLLIARRGRRFLDATTREGAGRGRRRRGACRRRSRCRSWALRHPKKATFRDIRESNASTRFRRQKNPGDEEGDQRGTAPAYSGKQTPKASQPLLGWQKNNSARSGKVQVNRGNSAVLGCGRESLHKGAVTT